MIEYDALAEFHDPETYDLECDDVVEELPLIEQWARSLGGPLLDIACGTGRTALRLVALGYSVTGVDVVPEMIERGRRKAAEQALSVEWTVADARAFQRQQRFHVSYMVGNAFQMFHTREDQEAMLARVREHLYPGGCFLFDTRLPTPRNLYETLFPSPQTLTTPDGGRLVVTHEQPRFDLLTQIQHLTSHHQWLLPDGSRVEKTNRIALRYTYPQEMEALLFHNGFQIAACYGSWQQEPLTETSREMVYVCRRRG